LRSQFLFEKVQNINSLSLSILTSGFTQQNIENLSSKIENEDIFLIIIEIKWD